jgi:hypothetical protein
MPVPAAATIVAEVRAQRTEAASAHGAPFVEKGQAYAVRGVPKVVPCARVDPIQDPWKDPSRWTAGSEIPDGTRIHMTR